MNKTGVLLVLAMATLILFAGCTSFRPYGQGSQNGAPQTESAPAQDEPAPSQAAPAEETPAPEPQGDYSITGQIERCDGDEICLTAVALEYESPAICAGLESYNEKRCYTQLAVKYRNAGYCNSLIRSYERDDCIEAVEAALDSQSAASESQILPSPNQEVTRGYADVPEQIERCESRTTNTEKANCLTALAVNYEIPAICEEIEYFNYECYAQVAITYDKPQYCQLPLSSEDRYLCESLLG